MKRLLVVMRASSFKPSLLRSQAVPPCTAHSHPIWRLEAVATCKCAFSNSTVAAWQSPC